MTTVRDKAQVVAAFETGDDLAIRRLGWPPVRDALATWWGSPPNRPLSMVVYAKVLGGEDPAKVLEAIEALATSKWRPEAAEIRGYLRRPDDDSRVHVGRGRDVYLRDEAVQAVAEALQAGERGCTCGTWHPSRWRADACRVLRCRTCGGLDTAQVYDALGDGDVVGDAEPIADAPLLLPSGAHG